MTAHELYVFLANNPEGTKLPDDSVIRGDLDLYWKHITWLPENLIVTGNMYISNCPNLKALPANLFVGGELVIMCSQIKALPADLCVRGDIWANNLDLDIPAGFTTNGGLYLTGEPDSPDAYRPSLRLPDNLTVHGVLDITNRSVEDWPKNLFIVKGSLVFGRLVRGDRRLIGINAISGTFVINRLDCENT